MMDQGNEYIINSDGDVVKNKDAYEMDSQEVLDNMDDSKDNVLESKKDNKKPKKSILKKNDPD